MALPNHEPPSGVARPRLVISQPPNEKEIPGPLRHLTEG